MSLDAFHSVCRRATLRRNGKVCATLRLASRRLTAYPSQVKEVEKGMAKRKAPSDLEADRLVTLEAAMAELGQIVSRLESGEETLDESLAKFERGMSLLRICHRQLDAAAQRIELVTQLGPDGEVLTEGFDSTSTLQRNTSSETARTGRKSAKDDQSDEDGGLLF